MWGGLIGRWGRIVLTTFWAVVEHHPLYVIHVILKWNRPSSIYPSSVHASECYCQHSPGFHTEFWVWRGGKQGGSRMIVACESTLTHVSVYVPTTGSGSMLPQEDFEFRSSQIASDTIWDKIVVKYLRQNNNHTQFQDFLGGGGGNCSWEGENSTPPPPPLYETLQNKQGQGLETSLG